ncbi:hypothetical protein V5F79_03210 [Xanthobacter flavus]|uniref:hypothetical protein n=1 Tax=Xanthobacter flavus TaxID=281 RepID=UPI0037290290
MIYIKFDNRTGEIISTLDVTRLEDALAAVRAGWEELLAGSAEPIDTAAHYVADGVICCRPSPPPIEATEVDAIVGAPAVLARGLPEGTTCTFAGGPGAPDVTLQDGVATVSPIARGVWSAEIAPPWPQQAAHCRIAVSAGA